MPPERSSHHPFQVESSRKDVSLSFLLGAIFAFALFAAMAAIQLLGDTPELEADMVEKVLVYTPPEVEEIEEDLPPPPEEEPPPELEVEPPQLSLDQLDIALNPGTGGAITGDFAMPTVTASAASLGTEDFIDFSEPDQVPRPMPGSNLDFPRRLKRKAVNGRVVLLIKLDEQGRVIESEVESSNLPEFEKIVASQVAKWRFTPPTRGGTPVRAQARFPIPINISG